MQRLKHTLTIGMQALEIDLRVVAHHLRQRGQLAVVHIGRGVGHAAQRRHLELAEVAVLQVDVARLQRGLPVARVAPAAEQVVGAGAQLGDAAVATGVDNAGAHKEGQADVGKFAVAEVRPAVAQSAATTADEELCAALGVLRITRSGSGVTAQQGVAKVIEGRAWARQAADPGAKGFGQQHGTALFIVVSLFTGRGFEPARKGAVTLQELVQMGRRGGHFALGGHRAQCLAP